MKIRPILWLLFLFVFLSGMFVTYIQTEKEAKQTREMTQISIYASYMAGQVNAYHNLLIPEFNQDSCTLADSLFFDEKIKEWFK